MATSGTTTLTISASELIGSAYELARVKDPIEDMTSDQSSKGIKSANKLLKYHQKNGLQLWAVKKGEVSLVEGEEYYTCGSGGTGLTERPLRIIEAFYRDGTTDTPLSIVSRQEYWDLGDKSTKGTPNQVYYDPQRTLGYLYVYNPANSDAAGNSIQLIYQRPFEIISDLEDEFDLPEEWLLPMEYLLAVDLALRNGIKQSRISQLKSEAQELFYEVSWWDAENTSVQIQPDES